MRGEENEMADDAEVRVARTRASEEAIRLWVGGDCTAELSTTSRSKVPRGHRSHAWAR